MIRSLSFEHFRAFRAPVRLPLAAQGQVLVCGRNRVSAACSSNGVGKSTVAVDALRWLLFGATTDPKERGDDVACRFTTATCRVVGELELDQTLWKVERTRRPAMLVLSGGREELRQERAATKLAALLPWGGATFNSTVVFGQRAAQFVTADSTTQRRIFEELLDLDFSAELARAREWAKRLAQAAVAADAERAVAQARLADTVRQVTALETQLGAFVALRRERLAEADAELAEAHRAERIAKQTERAATREVAAAQGLGAAVEVWEAWVATRDQLASDASEAGQRHSEAVAALVAVRKRLERATARDTCPTCLGPTGDAEVVRRRYAPELARLDAAVGATAEAVAEAARRHAAHMAQAPEEVTRAAFDAKVALAWQAHRSAEAQAAQATARRAKAATVRAAVAQERFTGAGLLTGLRTDRRTLTAALEANSRETARRARAQAVAGYWVGAFASTGIPNLVLEAEEPELTARLAHHLQTLAAGEARASISALERLKGGGVRERVTVTAAWDWGSGSLAGESAGQDQRVNLAIYAALQDVAEHRSAARFPFRVYDEPTAALDDLGKEILRDWIAAQAQARETTLVIAHDLAFEAAIQPDHVWTVVLGPEGATVEID